MANNTKISWFPTLPKETKPTAARLVYEFFLDKEEMHLQIQISGENGKIVAFENSQIPPEPFQPCNLMDSPVAYMKFR